jgi:hypothetical protein
LRIFSLLAALLVPSIALAQPAPPPPPPPMAGGPAAGMYGGAPDPWMSHQGITFEANLGLGYVHSSASVGGLSQTNDSDAALAGADFGIGGWVNPQLAITFRIAGVQVKNTVMGTTTPDNGQIIHAFFGPNVQYWFNPNVWIGGGAGFSTLRWLNHSDTDCTGDGCGTNGFGFNLRAGYSFGAGGPHTFNISVETNTGFYSPNDGMGNTIDITATGIALLAGYQYL